MKCKAVKIVLRVLSILAIVVAVSLLLLSLRCGTIIRTAVNTFGPQVLGVPVSLDSVSVYPLSGKVRLRALVIGNPDGFDTPYIFRMESLSIDIAVKDLLLGKVHINDITIDGPRVWYHHKLSTSNVGAFMNILEAKYPEKPKEQLSDNDKDKDKKQVPVVIDHLLVKEGTIGLKFGVGGEIPLLKIELFDIGKSGALLPAQILKLLVTSIFNGVISAVGNIGEAAVDGVTAVGGVAVDAVSAVGSGIIDGVGSLFSSKTNDTVKAK